MKKKAKANKGKVKSKKSKEADPYAEWKCPKCGSYDTRKRYGRRYGDTDLLSGQRPEFAGEYYLLICNDCGTSTPIDEEKYNKMQLKNYKQK